MKETPLSTSEKLFVQQAVKEGQRVDGRGLTEHREINISYGTEWGCCQVLLGNTRVAAQISCSVQVPKASRPNEGMLFINVEMSPMAAEHFEAGRLGKFGIEVNRLVERCIKDSRCVDLESLCILCEEKAWEVRADVHILNHDGNLVDAATLATLGALCHFRRPDVTLEGREVTIHSLEERDPVQLTILHHPLALTFALFNKGQICVLDPTSLEERSADGKLTMGLNAYRELCTLQIAGEGVFINKEAVLSCANVAANRAIEMVNALKSALAADAVERSKEDYEGLVSCVAMESKRITTQTQAAVRLPRPQLLPPVDNEMSEEEREIPVKLTNEQGVVSIETIESDDESMESEVEVVNQVPAVERKRVNQVVELGDDSEEEPIVLSASDLG